MHTLSFIIGLAIGCILAYILLYWINKAKTVKKTDFDTLSLKFNDTST